MYQSSDVLHWVFGGVSVELKFSVIERAKLLVFSMLVQKSKHEKYSEKLLVCDFLALLSHTPRAQKVWMTVWIFVVF